MKVMPVVLDEEGERLFSLLYAVSTKQTPDLASAVFKIGLVEAVKDVGCRARAYRDLKVKAESS